MSGDELIVVSAQDQIKLFSGDCYVVQYTYAADGRKEILFYAWIGQESVLVCITVNFQQFLCRSVVFKCGIMNIRVVKDLCHEI